MFGTDTDGEQEVPAAGIARGDAGAQRGPPVVGDADAAHHDPGDGDDPRRDRPAAQPPGHRPVQRPRPPRPRPRPRPRPGPRGRGAADDDDDAGRRLRPGVAPPPPTGPRRLLAGRRAGAHRPVARQKTHQLLRRRAALTAPLPQKTRIRGPPSFSHFS